ncbi:hypothetical protein CYJ15_12575 [Heyndrickxia coagulans]|nr:hypothetical protein CYJ15_12575 [Heyndrickxia coagulans]
MGELNMPQKRIDITGQRFGRLVAIREVEPIGYARRYLCKCDCGKEKIVRMNQLRTGKTKSCGCLNREVTSKKNTVNLTGKRFGKLTVTGRSNKKHDTQTKAIWHCRCDCGNEIDVLSTYLTSGEVKSCGCHRREIGKNLQKYNAEHLQKDGVFIPILKSKVRSDSSTGIKGVTLNRKSGKYRASLTIKGKRIYLGEYESIENAAKARKAGEEKYFRPYLEENDED